jgi:hypothetical protein
VVDRQFLTDDEVADDEVTAHPCTPVEVTK